MKITGFRPGIVAKDISNITSLFEELGFEAAHSKNDIEGRPDVKSFNYKDQDGHVINITEVPQMPADLATVSVNVDDIEEAVKIFEKYGFVNTTGKIEITGTSKTANMASPKGLVFDISQHIK